MNDKTFVSLTGKATNEKVTKRDSVQRTSMAGTKRAPIFKTSLSSVAILSIGSTKKYVC